MYDDVTSYSIIKMHKFFYHSIFCGILKKNRDVAIPSTSINREEQKTKGHEHGFSSTVRFYKSS
jgi:hypothetical protein